MQNGQIKEETRPLTKDPGSIVPMHTDDAPKQSLLEAYKKHSAELTAIEDRQNKLLLLILGIFGAGATLLGSSRAASITFYGRGGLTFLAVVISGIGWYYNRELHDLRRA